MSQQNFVKRNNAAIAVPAVGSIAIFYSIELASWAMKDDTNTVTAIGGGGGGGVETAYEQRVDDTGTYVYFGWAEPGELESAATWRIKRVTVATGVGKLADGDDNFDNVWDNRASLSY